MIERKEECRVCNNKIEPLLSYGKMPIANGFINAGEEESEYFFDLSPAFCTQCFTFQLIEQPAPEKMFHGDYAFQDNLNLCKFTLKNMQNGLGLIILIQTTILLSK